MSARQWETAFFAVSTVLGEPLEIALGAAGEPTTGEASTLIRVLRSGSREQRARAVARVATELGFEVEATGLA